MHGRFDLSLYAHSLFVLAMLSVDPVLVMCRAMSNLFICERLAAAKGGGGKHEKAKQGRSHYELSKDSEGVF